MIWWGRALGLLFGLQLGGFFGALLGFYIGYQFDQGVARQQGFFSNQQTRQSLFFEATFATLGHLSKAKGRVTETDIQLAQAAMDRLQLQPAARQTAQQAFRRGKQADFPLREVLSEFRSACLGRSDLLQIFMEIQLQAAFADGQLHPREREVLSIIAETLAISNQQLMQLLAMLEGAQHFSQQQDHSGYHHRKAYQATALQPSFADACKVLGVNASDNAVTIKRAYRKLMSQHHPDKLVAKGLPPAMMELAKQKTQKIQAAYDLIKKEQNFK